jgi:hypothetical protein
VTDIFAELREPYVRPTLIFNARQIKEFSAFLGMTPEEFCRVGNVIEAPCLPR